MLYYSGIDICEGIDAAESNNKNKCIICYYWFFNHGFQFRVFYVMILMILLMTLKNLKKFIF